MFKPMRCEENYTDLQVGCKFTLDLVKGTVKSLIFNFSFYAGNSRVLDLLDLFHCDIEEQEVNLVIFLMRGGNSWRKTYL